MSYADKDNGLIEAKYDIEVGLCKMHPTDEAEALRVLEAWTGKRAAKQEAANERDGVPERDRKVTQP